MKKIINIITMIVIIMFFSACEDTNNTTNDNININYDVETNTNNINVSNGENVFLGSFIVYVNNSTQEDVYVKKINFNLTGSYASEEEELAFYQAIKNLHVFVNDTEVETSKKATEFNITPLKKVSDQMPLYIEIWADEIKAEIAKTEGFISIESIRFGNTDQIGYDSKQIEKQWLPDLGNSNQTALDALIDDQFAANWQFNNITIINTIECPEGEIQLNDGSCVYDQCNDQKPYCSHGKCQTNLNNGGVECICYPGYTNSETYSICNIRTARFDIEHSEENFYTNNGENQLLAEWSLFINEAEDAYFLQISFHLEGNYEAFSNFRLTIEKNNTEINFGNIHDAFEYYHDPNDMYLYFSRTEPDFTSIILNKGSIRKIRLYADVNGESEDYLHLKMNYVVLSSNEIDSPLELDHSLGNNLYTAVSSEEDPSSFPWASFPKIHIN